MSDKDKPDNVIPFGPKKPKETDFKKVSHLVDDAMKGIISSLSDEDRDSFEKFLLHKHPDLAISLMIKDAKLDNPDAWNIDVTEIAADIELNEKLSAEVQQQMAELHSHIMKSYADLDLDDMKFYHEALGTMLNAIKSLKNV